MKKLTVCLMLAVFAMVSSLQAGEKAEKSKAADSAKSSCSTSVQASCGEKSACCAKTTTTVKARHAMRGATLLALR